jgi:hypothetical protein
MWNKTELIDINGSQDIYLREQTPPYFSRRGSHQRVEWRGRGAEIGRYLEYINIYIHIVTVLRHRLENKEQAGGPI